MQKVSTNPAARHKTKTFTNSLVRYLMCSCVPVPWRWLSMNNRGGEKRHPDNQNR